MRRRPRIVALGGLVVLLCVAQLGCGSSSSSPPPPTVSHRVDLGWTASTSQVVGYNIYRGGQSMGPYTRLNSQVNVATSFTDTNVVAGSTYYYTVTAVDAASSESTYSDEVSATVPTP
jgi:fibronectin type 3 domain-containing protein